jgi:hypothetical protein
MGCARERALGWLAGSAGPGFLHGTWTCWLAARLGVLQCILECVTERLTRAVFPIHTCWEGRTDEFRVCSLKLLFGAFGPSGDGGDEPESLILAQSERWRHA